MYSTAQSREQASLIFNLAAKILPALAKYTAYTHLVVTGE